MDHPSRTAIVSQDEGWWIGWIAEVPGVNAQERTREELLVTLAEVLREALEMNRQDARGNPRERTATRKLPSLSDRIYRTSGSETPRSRQIFLARNGLISLWCGTADRSPVAPFSHHSCLRPCRNRRQPLRSGCLDEQTPVHGAPGKCGRRSGPVDVRRGRRSRRCGCRCSSLRGRRGATSPPRPPPRGRRCA